MIAQQVGFLISILFVIHADAHRKEVRKLEGVRHVEEVAPEEARTSPVPWYIPHQMVHCNGKSSVTFNCSFECKGQSLNEQLLPGPVLGPTLIGVLLSLHMKAAAISGNIKGMFHQTHQPPTDRPTVRFTWSDLQPRQEPTVYEWKEVPFGTTSSPCCAISLYRSKPKRTCTTPRSSRVLPTRTTASPE